MACRQPRSASEDQFHGHLHDPWSRSARDHSETRAVGGHYWRIEIRVIEDIERLAAKLEVESLQNIEALEERIIDVPHAGSAQLTSSRRPDGADLINSE